jgi:hypothetical protein
LLLNSGMICYWSIQILYNITKKRAPLREPSEVESRDRKLITRSRIHFKLAGALRGMETFHMINLLSGLSEQFA